MRPHKNIPLMYLIVFLQGLIFYGAVSTVYRQAKGLSMTDIFVIESVSWIVMLLIEIPWGYFADRFGYKKTLLISNFMFFLSKIVFFQASSFSMFLLERILLSVSLSGLSGCDITLLYLSKGPEDNSERLFARYRWCATSGLLAASLLSPLLLRISLEATAFWTVVPYGLAFIATLFLEDIRGDCREKPSLLRSIRAILQNKLFLLYIVAAALLTEIVQSVTVFLNQPQYLRSGIGLAFFGPLLALMQLIRLITVTSHRLSSRFGDTRSVLGLFILITFCCAGLIWTSSAALSIILIGLVGGGMALCEPMVIDAQNRSVTTGDRATTLSVYSMCSSLIAAGVNPLIGLGADSSVQTGFIICAGISAAAVLLMLIYHITSIKRRSEPAT